MEFAYDGGGLGKGGTVTLFIDGKKVGEGRVDATLANVFSADDGCDVGEDNGAPVSPDYGPHGNAFNGTVKGVQLAIAEAADDADHLVDPANRDPRRDGAAVSTLTPAALLGAAGVEGATEPFNRNQPCRSASVG